jgi:hypothetical protein
MHVYFQIYNLKQAVEAHTESVHYLKQEKEKLESELQILQAKVCFFLRLRSKDTRNKKQEKQNPLMLKL